MYGDLLRQLNEKCHELNEDRLDMLLDALEAQGFQVAEVNRESMTSADIDDAWVELRDGGPEAAVSYLETMFGFNLNKGKNV